MIELFENITYELTDKELSLVPDFVRSFKKRIGKENAVTATEIQEKMIISGARIRKIINYIRNNYLVPGLIASSDGYYISTNKEEVKEYIQSLGHREAAIGAIRKTFEEYIKTL